MASTIGRTASVSPILEKNEPKPTLRMSTVSKNLLLGLAYCLATAVLLFPVWYVDFVPTTDFPTHLSRIYVLSVLDMNPTLAEMYEADWDFVPNLATDIFILSAMKFVPLFAAGKLLISVSVVMWIAGTAWLNRVLTGQYSIVPLFAAIFVLNACFFLGFMNYMAAAGVALVGFAAWAAMASWRVPVRLMCVIPLTVLAYFTHIVGFVILACCMFGFELGREIAEPRPSWRRGLRRLAVPAIAILPVVAIFVFLSPHEGHDRPWAFGSIAQYPTRIGYAASLMNGRAYYVALAFVALAGALGLATRKMTIERRMWPVLFGLVVAAIIAPTSMLGGAYVDARLPPIIGCLGIASIKEHAGRRTKAVLGCVLAGLLIYRTGVVTESWITYDREYTELAAAAAPIEPGSKVFAAQFTPKSAAGHNAMMIHMHYLDLIGVQRNLFTPIILAWPAQHPMRHTHAYDDLAASSSYGGILQHNRNLMPLALAEHNKFTEQTPYLFHWQCKFDYLVNLHVNGDKNPAPAMLETWHRGTFFTIYKIIKNRKECG